MKNLLRFALASLVLSSLAGLASAHFIWLHVPSDGTRLQVLFGDGIYQDSDANLVRYVEGLEAWVVKDEPLSFEAHSWGLSSQIPAGTKSVAAYRDMGLFSRPGPGSPPPVKLDYYAKGARRLADASHVVGTRAELVGRAEGTDIVLQTWFDGEPAAGAELTVPRWDSPATVKLVADENGEVRVSRPPSGSFAVRARIVVDAPGELDGEAYVAEHHWATLVISSLRDTGIPAGADLDAWVRFEEIHRSLERLPEGLNGLGGLLRLKASSVDARGEFECVGGKLTQFALEGVSDEWMDLVRSHVLDMVRARAHRAFSEAAGRHPITLGQRTGHPLGRPVHLGDGANTSYLISEDRIQCMETDTNQGRLLQRFLAYETTEEGRFLPHHSTRHWLDPESGALVRSESMTETFRDYDGIFLPVSRLVTSSGSGPSTTFQVELRNLELLWNDDAAGVIEASVDDGER